MPLAPPPPAVSQEQFLLAYLQAHQPACPACGYNVHALTIARCPECGRDLALRIVARDRVSRSWMLAMLTASLSAGVGLLTLVVVIHEGWPHEASLIGLVFNIVLPFFLASIPAAALPLMLRRRFSTLSPAARHAIALLHALVSAAMFIAFLWAVAR